MGGWQAENESLFIACFGSTVEDAELALNAARERALLLDYRLSLAPETDVGLSDDESAALDEAYRDLAVGNVRTVTLRH